MKKVLILVILVVLLGAGGYYLYKHNKTYVQPTAPTTSSGNVFTSIQDALNRSLSLSCDFTDANGVHTVAYIKNGAIRADVTGKTPQESGSMIMKDKKIYYWNSSMAIMMDVPSITVTPGPTESPASSNAGEVTMNSLEQYRQHCKVATVADNLFALPANVKFSDASQMMKGLPTNVPTSSSTSTGGYAVPTQYQQYLPK